MHIPSAIRKIFEGVASRCEMHHMFNRHRGAPAVADAVAGDLFAGEWFEVAERDYNYMFEILPPLLMRGDMFALSEYMTGSVTSVFFALSIDGRIRWFHGYCDLSDRGSPDRMKAAIIVRETRPVRAMTREERRAHLVEHALRLSRLCWRALACRHARQANRSGLWRWSRHRSEAAR
jgi:Protein of unknown function (DUF1419)